MPGTSPATWQGAIRQWGIPLTRSEWLHRKALGRDWMAGLWGIITTKAIRSPFVGAIAHTIGTAQLLYTVLVGPAGLTAPSYTRSSALIFCFTSLTQTLSAGPYCATVSSIAKAVAALAVFRAIDIGHVLGPDLLRASIRDDFFQGRQLEPPPFGRRKRPYVRKFLWHKVIRRCGIGACSRWIGRPWVDTDLGWT